ncbi:MAG: tetratricopeptide repeat protein [Elusimicrobia bacterium]|nr:tetratricopeptide repeat protein [Elusimicrobiota bacterium]
MIWDNPRFLIALIVVPFLVLFFVFEWRVRKKISRKFADAEVFPKLSSRNPQAEILRRIFLVFAYVFFVLAAASPRWGYRKMKIEEKKSSVIIALDVSASMLCEDVKPNRLKLSIRKIKELLTILKSQRFGIVGFAGKAFTICPLTEDVSSVREFLDEVGVASIPYPGTNIENALLKAKESFVSETAAKSIIMFTDGENLQGDPESALKQIRGIEVFIVGAGTPEGEPIPIRDKNGNVKGYKKDKNGETVISHLDETTLLKIANGTGGMYVPQTPDDSDIEQIADKINSKGSSATARRTRKMLARKSYIPLTFAFLFLIADFLFAYLFGKKTIFEARNIPVVFLVLFFCSKASAGNFSRGNRSFNNRDYFKAEKFYREELKKRSSAEIYYNLANTYYCQGKYDEAEKQYNKAFTFNNRKMKEDVLYNMGNNYFRKNQFAKAAACYREVLRMNPCAKDALHNLEVVLRRKSKGKSQKQRRGGEKEKKKKTMSKEDLQRVLNVIQNMENQKRKMKRKKMPRVLKDW